MAAFNLGGAASRIGQDLKGVFNALNPQGKQYPFTLGSFTFSNLELPQQLTSLGGDQRVAVHEFPGGVRTVQSLGAFPPDEIRWKGIFTGVTALPRSYTLDRLRVTGAPIVLTYGPQKWSGVIKTFNSHVKNQWLINYDILFVPQVDLSSPAPQGATDVRLKVLNQATGGLAKNIPITIFGDTLPSGLSSALSSVLSYTNTALLDADNVLDVVDPSLVNKVNFYVQAAKSLGEGIQSGNGPLSMIASVTHVLSHAGIIANVFTTNSPISKTLRLINPNLITLASQYFGDPARASDIAKFNNITNTTPTGQYDVNLPSQLGPPPTSGSYA